jgi:hypothetical protein
MTTTTLTRAAGLAAVAGSKPGYAADLLAVADGGTATPRAGSRRVQTAGAA